MDGKTNTTLVIYDHSQSTCQNAMTPVINDYLASNTHLAAYWSSLLPGGTSPTAIKFRCVWREEDSLKPFR